MKAPLFALAGAGLAQAQLRLSFSRQPAETTSHSGHAVRDDTQNNPSLNWLKNTYAYMVNASVGTPAQQVEMMLSFSSSESWVLDPTGYCTEVLTCTYGTFNWKRSSTFVLAEIGESSPDDEFDSDGEFYVSTPENDYAYGVSFRDTLTLGGLEVPDFPMGLVNMSSGPVSMLGIGYNTSADVSFPVRLVDQGLINTTAYSIWPDNANASSGSILFGAVDKAKYSGDLVRIDSTPYSSNMGFTVDLYSINGTANSSLVQQVDDNILPMSVLVSPSHAVSDLPSVLAQQIWDIVGATYDISSGSALIPCSAADSANFFLFALGDWSGPVISATMADLVMPKADFPVHHRDSKDTCVFGIQSGNSDYSSSTWTLGGTLLRHTYSVFDLVNSEIAFARASYVVDAEDVVVFDKYGATVPGAAKVCPARGCRNSTSQVGSGSSGSGSSSSGSSSSGSSSSGSSSNGSGSGDDDGDDGDDGNDGTEPYILSIGAVVGIAVGVAVGVLLIGGIVIIVIRSRRRKSAGEAAAAAAEKGVRTSSDAGASDIAAPPRASTRGGFLAPPGRPSRVAPAGYVPSIEVTPAGAFEGPVPSLPPHVAPPEPRGEAAAAVPTTEPPVIPAPTEAPPEVPAAVDESGESSKGKGPEHQ